MNAAPFGMIFVILPIVGLFLWGLDHLFFGGDSTRVIMTFLIGVFAGWLDRGRS